ncbi:PHP domain-containing protein [Vallicoccus soli]|uniref:PHP domain-containing protein n=1 Tax=Vallicoccus soli TaxID=2339232 RepID=A0A3A3ZAE4_9ACTN|nr:PHP domain-containing protein [Vallicoccus soli]RJK98056.1 PHP domain-containing protein [Vallicoccus soli]
MRIDLHTHSRASDGTDAPAGVVAAAAAAGLDVVALTDHDTTSGWAAAAAALDALARPLVLVPGMELSCEHEGTSLHLLAYLADPAHPALAAAVARVREDRVPRARAMVESLAAAGLPVTWEAVLARAAGGTVGRPHLADALVDAGAVRDRDEAFAGPLSTRSPHFVRHATLPALEAVRLVVAAGGVPVLAHPRAGRRGRTVDDAAVAAMAREGLAGLEVDHRDHEPAERAHLRGLAADLGLLTTGSSDYHGTGKRNRIGEETTPPEAYEALLDRATGAVRPLTAGAAA